MFNRGNTLALKVEGATGKGDENSGYPECDGRLERRALDELAKPGGGREE